MRRYKKLLKLSIGFLLCSMLTSCENSENSDNMIYQIPNGQENMSVIWQENDDISLIQPVIIENIGKKESGEYAINKNNDENSNDESGKVIPLKIN